MIKIILLLISLMSMNTEDSQNTNDNSLIYIGDPMCSWCYGFGPELTKVKNALPNDVQFQILMGGLRPNGKQTMAELHDFLKEHWEEIHTRTGQPFSFDILEQSAFIYNTEPACRAVVTAREIAPEKAYEFFELTQSAFYFKNKNTTDIDTYLEIAESLDIDRNAFKRGFNSDEMVRATKADFQMAGQLGVNSFPTLILKKGTEFFLVSQGYQESEAILSSVTKALE